MPVQIYAEINGKPVQTYHIARVRKNVADDEWTDYQIVQAPGTERKDASYSGLLYRLWDDEGIVFQHRREDGINQLIIKALTALEEKAQGTMKNLETSKEVKK